MLTRLTSAVAHATDVHSNNDNGPRRGRCRNKREALFFCSRADGLAGSGHVLAHARHGVAALQYDAKYDQRRQHDSSAHDGTPDLNIRGIRVSSESPHMERLGTRPLAVKN